MSQYLNLVKSTSEGSPLALLSSLAPGFQEKITSLVGGKIENLANASSDTVGNVSNAIQVQAPVLSDSISSVSKIYRWRNTIVVIISIWVLAMILIRIFNDNEKLQEHLEKATDLVIGKSGALSLIVNIWVGAILLVALVPAIISITPKLEGFLGSISSVVDLMKPALA